MICVSSGIQARVFRDESLTHDGDLFHHRDLRCQQPDEVNACGQPSLIIVDRIEGQPVGALSQRAVMQDPHAPSA